MASNLVTPQITEQLPPYTSDPETASVSSRAPSYTSAAPAYDHVISSPVAAFSNSNDAIYERGDGVSSLSSAAVNGTTTSVTNTTSSLITTSHSPAISEQQARSLIPSHRSASAHSSHHDRQPGFTRTSGLPNHPFAEGFIPRLPGSIPNTTCFDNNVISPQRPHNARSYLNSSNFTDNWPSTRNSHATRQYHAVAKRRAREGREGLDQFKNSSKSNSRSSVNASVYGIDGSSGISQCDDNAAGMPKKISGVKLEAGSSASSSPSTEGVSAAASEARTADVIIDPLEDPYLVGEEAAKRAKETRIYREMCLREAEDMKGEGKVSDINLYI